MNLDPTLLRPTSILGYVLVFLGGVVTSIGPCNLATIPLVVGFVGGSHDLTRSRSFTLSLAFSLGLAITFTSLGVVAALVGGLIGGASRLWYYLVAAVCFIIGLHMLGVLSFPVPMWLGGVRERIKLKGSLGALALGLLSGLVASQCATPVLAAILTYVMSKGALGYGAVLLFVYAMGRGVPVVLAGTFVGVFKQLQEMGHWSNVIEKASGFIILAVGFYFLWIA